MCETTSSFGERLGRLREEASLTHEELAERVGLTVQAVGALETGKRRRPYPATVRAIAHALDLSAADRADLTAAVAGRHQQASTPAAITLPDSPNDPIGREMERADVTEILLSRRTRLLTLTCPGGIGKTSLELATTSATASAFPDGVTFVDLAPASTSDLVEPGFRKRWASRRLARDE